jgi:asparagine synthase (glutamine-hydrolysing)
VGRWLNSELDQLKKYYLSAPILNALGLFNMPAVERLLTEHQAKKADHTFRIWNLMVFSAWSQRYGIVA